MSFPKFLAGKPVSASKYTKRTVRIFVLKKNEVTRCSKDSASYEGLHRLMQR